MRTKKRILYCENLIAVCLCLKVNASELKYKILVFKKKIYLVMLALSLHKLS